MRMGSEETFARDRITFAPVELPTTSSTAETERPGIDKAEHISNAAELGTSSEEDDIATPKSEEDAGVPCIARVIGELLMRNLAVSMAPRTF